MKWKILLNFGLGFEIHRYTRKSEEETQRRNQITDITN